MEEYTFVDGIGDEVVLFTGFLLLSIGFLVVVGFRQSRHGHARGADNEDSARTREEEGTDASNAVPEQETEGLRHRTTTSSSPAESPGPGTSSTAMPTAGLFQGPESRYENVEENSSSNQNNSSFTIRLVVAGRTDRPKEVRVTASSTLEQIRNSHFQAELAQNCPVRFIYQGRLIPDDTTIGSLGVTAGGAVHIHIGRPRPQDAPPSPPPAPMQQLDLSQYFLPLLGLILGIVWVAMLMYPYVFTFFTKVFLFALSLGYVVLTYFSTVGATN